MENNINNASQKPTKQNGTGPIVGSIIIILVVIVGGFYFWESKIIKERRLLEVENQAMNASAHASSSIESDIEVDRLDVQDDKELDKLNEEIQKL